MRGEEDDDDDDKYGQEGGSGELRERRRWRTYPPPGFVADAMLSISGFSPWSLRALAERTQSPFTTEREVEGNGGRGGRERGSLTRKRDEEVEGGTTEKNMKKDNERCG